MRTVLIPGKVEHAPIIIIDDDIEDVDLLKEMIVETGFDNDIVTFNDPLAALGFLQKMVIQPLFILCDINMPKMNGFQLRTSLLAIDSGIKEVPFLFLSTSCTDQETNTANELKVHAYYQKSPSFTGMREILENIRVLLRITP